MCQGSTTEEFQTADEKRRMAAIPAVREACGLDDWMPSYQVSQPDNESESHELHVLQVLLQD